MKNKIEFYVEAPANDDDTTSCYITFNDRVLLVEIWHDENDALKIFDGEDEDHDTTINSEFTEEEQKEIFNNVVKIMEVEDYLCQK